MMLPWAPGPNLYGLPLRKAPLVHGGIFWFTHPSQLSWSVAVLESLTSVKVSSAEARGANSNPAASDPRRTARQNRLDGEGTKAPFWSGSVPDYGARSQQRDRRFSDRTL